MSIDRDWGLVGTLLRDFDALAEVRDVLKPSDLAAGASLAYEAICALNDEGAIASIDGIARWAEAAEHWDPRLDAMGGPAALRVRCIKAASLPAPSNVRGLAFEIKRESLHQRLAQYLYLTYQRASRPIPDLTEFVGEIETALADLKPVGTNPIMAASEAAKACVELHEAPTTPLICHTGLEALDAMLGGGFEAGRLYVIGARPGMGKTALALEVARRVAHRGHGSLVCSLEMSPTECFARLIASESRVNSHCISRGTTPTHLLGKLTKGLASMQALPIGIADAAGQSIFGVSSIIRRAARGAEGIGLAIIDYLGLLTPAKSQPKEQWARKGDNCRHLKLLAARLGIPIIILAQIAQRADGRRPTLADFYGSGEIAMHADVCMALYRPEVYDPDEAPGVCEVGVLKNRSGCVGRVELRYTPEHNHFGNLGKPELEVVI